RYLRADRGGAHRRTHGSGHGRMGPRRPQRGENSLSRKGASVRRLRKWLLRAIGSLIILMLVVTITFVTVLQTHWLREKIRLRIITEVEKATGGRVELGSFDFDPAALEVTVKDFILRGNEPTGEPPLAHVARIRVGVKMLSFARSDIFVESLE